MNRSVKLKRRMLFIMIVYHFYIIFSFSAQPALESKAGSESVTGFIYDKFVVYFENYIPIGRDSFIELANHTVRKCAHFGNFFLLSLLVSAYVLDYKKSMEVSFICVFGVCAMLAVSDELHQLFVEGRGCQIADMLLDSCGSMLGILFFFTFNIKKQEKIL